MPITSDNSITWAKDFSSLKTSKAMASVIHDAMVLACTAVNNKNLLPMVKKLNNVFYIPAIDYGLLQTHTRRLTSHLKRCKTEQAQYAMVGGDKLGHEVFRSTTHPSNIDFASRLQTLKLYYELVILPWDGLITYRSPRQFLSLFTKLPDTPKFNEAIEGIEILLQGAGYINNKQNFGRRFRILKQNLGKILLPKRDDSLLHDII